jgi:hypothetical protein
MIKENFTLKKGLELAGYLSELAGYFGELAGYFKP